MTHSLFLNISFPQTFVDYCFLMVPCISFVDYEWSQVVKFVLNRLHLCQCTLHVVFNEPKRPKSPSSRP